MTISSVLCAVGSSKMPFSRPADIPSVVSACPLGWEDQDRMIQDRVLDLIGLDYLFLNPIHSQMEHLDLISLHVNMIPLDLYYQIDL